MKTTGSRPAMRRGVLPTDNQRGGNSTRGTMAIMRLGQGSRKTVMGGDVDLQQCLSPACPFGWWLAGRDDFPTVELTPEPPPLPRLFESAWLMKGAQADGSALWRSCIFLLSFNYSVALYVMHRFVILSGPFVMHTLVDMSDMAGYIAEHKELSPDSLGEGTARDGPRMKEEDLRVSAARELHRPSG
ncbi:uncharacterized protein BJX67DRAFT_63710 [Aspergillus lucknowensis]|uniref:Uncharacterized protein n=1 Tax=Aspergillus lucknowensis TaxID=176173 RepID=A0ABR4LUG9_9EURO